MKLTVTVSSVIGNGAPSREQRAVEALKKQDPLLAQAILQGLEEPAQDELSVRVTATGDLGSLTFAVLQDDAPRVGDVYEVEVTKRSRAKLIAELDDATGSPV